MRLYELVLVLKPSLSDVQRKKVFETIKGLLKELKITKEEEWGQKPLAYAIKHEVAGFYQLFQFEGETVPADFERRILQNDTVLRHLLIRKK